LKTVPHSIESERGVLGSVILDPSKFNKITLDASDFYDGRHSALWDSLSEMYKTGQAIDALTIHQYLSKNNLLGRVGGEDYLLDLQDSILVTAHSQHYAREVKRTSKLRNEIYILEDGLRSAYMGESATTSTVQDLISAGIQEDEELDIDQLADNFIDDCAEGKVGHFGWWCYDWTRYLGKMSSDLMILHAPRSTGKTALMLQWIVNAHQGGQRVPLASIEMLKKELAPRFIANVGQVTTFTMRTRGHITEDEEQRSRQAVKDIRALNLCIRDKAMTIDDIRLWATSEARNGIDAIFIDNLLSISDGGKNYQSKTIMYDDFIRKFRDLRDQLKIPIIILAHPNAEGQVAWSKDVENFADIILYMAEVPPTGADINGFKIEPIDGQGKHILAKFQKNRQGISPMASLRFHGGTQSFEHVRWEGV